MGCAASVIYASSDDRCAHIVLSIWAEMAQGRWAVRIQSPVRLHPPEECGNVGADAVRTAEGLPATSCCHGQKKKFKVPINLNLRWRRDGGGGRLKCQENIRSEYNHLLRAIPESGVQYSTLHLLGYFSAFRNEERCQYCLLSPLFAASSRYNVLTPFSACHFTSLFANIYRGVRK